MCVMLDSVFIIAQNQEYKPAARQTQIGWLAKILLFTQKTVFVVYDDQKY